MDARLLSKLAVLSGFALLFATGCPRPAPPENAVTWGVKAATGQLTQTTPREWQALAEKVDELTPQADLPPLTDEQAAAIVEFVQLNDLNSIQQITALIEQAQTNPSSVENLQIPDGLIESFSGADLQSISDAVLG